MAETAPQPKTSSGLAIAGLVLGIIAILTSFLPIINNLSFFIALIGGVLAAIALVGALRGKHTAKGMSIAGVVLAVVSIVVVLVTQSAYSAALKAASDELSSNSKPVASSTESSSSSDSSKKSEEKAEEPAEEKAEEPAEEKAEEKAEEPVDSEYAVTIDSATVGTDYSDNPCVFITYTFTNVSDDDASAFISSVTADVYQDGVQCETAFADTDGGGNSMTKVKKGSSIEVVQAYELQNTTSDVEVEVKELFAWDDIKLATRTFQIA